MYEPKKWPEGSLEHLIWQYCEADDNYVRIIMRRVNAEIIRALIKEIDGNLYDSTMADVRIAALTRQLQELEGKK